MSDSRLFCCRHHKISTETDLSAAYAGTGPFLWNFPAFMPGFTIFLRILV